ncbi:Phosphoribosylglycinamide formyltransferase [Thalassocella blandensis]|nr:Phosphoribosylglycinamide formyltransferase [Thalassocella blandensis]
MASNTLDNSSKARVVVLISGSGSNLQAIIDQTEQGQLPIEICAVISNKDNVKGLERAAHHNIPAIVLDHTLFDSRESFDLRLQEIIDAQSPDIIVLAGFMRILTEAFTRHFEGKMLNIHPSLLPKYTGLHTHRRALEAGDKEHGVTVHFVTSELDGGPPVIQARVPVLDDDTEASLAARVLQQEHHIYPLAVRWMAEKRLEMRDNKCWLDGEVLPPSGHQY